VIVQILLEKTRLAQCSRQIVHHCRLTVCYWSYQKILFGPRQKIANRRLLQEGADAVSDFAGMCFERKVAGVEEADNRTRIVALESLGPRRHKERVIFAPHRQKRRLVSAEVVLE